MTINDVTIDIGFMVGGVADAVVVAVAPCVVAPIVATPLFGKAIGTFLALVSFKRRLPYLVGVSDERVSDEHVLLGAIAEVKADVVRGDDVSFKAILIGLLHEETAILTDDDVVQDPGIIELLEHHPVPAIGEHEIAFHERLPAEHQCGADDVMRQ